ncbi:MAG: FAD-binding oxidoreductase [Thermoprotei archaeon]
MSCERPADFAGVAEVVKSSERVFFVGQGRHLVTQHEGTCVSLSNFSSTLEVSQEDLYVTVQAGKALSELSRELESRGLFLPIVHNGTVGGALGLNVPSEFSFWFGYPSDLVLEARTVTGLGEVVRTGAKTPKFSSGYKIYKALAGSLGLLGAYLEVTFKVFPKPESLVYALVSDPKKALESPFRPYGGIAINLDGLISYVVIGGWKEKVDRAVRELGARAVTEERPRLEALESCTRLASVSVPRGLEADYLSRLGRGVGYIGSGTVLLCNPDVKELRRRGFTAVVIRGCHRGEDCFGFKSRTLELLSKALDPQGKFLTINPLPW